MFADRVSKALDMQCIMEYHGANPMVDFSKKFNIDIPAAFVKNKDETYGILYFIPGIENLSRDAKLFIDMFKGRDHNGIWTIYARADKYVQMSYLSRLSQIPSVVLDVFLLKNGVHKFYFRFHSSVMIEVTDFLGDLMGNNKNFGIAYCGPSLGLSKSVEDFSAVFPTILVGLRYDSVEPMAKKNEYYLETRFHTGSGIIRSVIYMKKGDFLTQNGKQVKCNTLDFEDKNSIIDWIFSMNDGMTILPQSIIRRMQDGTTELEIVVPTFFRRELQNRIYSAMSKFSSSHLSLLYVRDLPELMSTVS